MLRWLLKIVLSNCWVIMGKKYIKKYTKKLYFTNVVKSENCLNFKKFKRRNIQLIVYHLGYVISIKCLQKCSGWDELINIDKLWFVSWTLNLKIVKYVSVSSTALLLSDFLAQLCHYKIKSIWWKNIYGKNVDKFIFMDMIYKKCWQQLF